MTYSEASKKATYAYREKNLDKHLELTRLYVKTHYDKNREKKIAKVLDRYYFKKELALFRNILLGEESF